MGLISADISGRPHEVISEMIAMSVAPLSEDKIFDFGSTQIATDLSDRGMEIAGDRELWHVPPAETVFLQRKLGGMYLLAARLQARVNVAALIRETI